MMFTNKIRWVIKRTRRLLDNAREIVPYSQTAVRKPATLIVVLLTARRAQITLALLLVFMFFLAPAIVDFITGLLFPPETSKKLFGLINTQQTNQWKYIAYTAIMAVSWITAIIWVLLLTWLNIPVGLNRANARARKLLNEAKELSEKLQRRKIYQRALALATDPGLEEEIGRLTKHTSDPEDTNFDATKLHVDKPKANASLEVSNDPTLRRDIATVSDLSNRYEMGETIGKGAMGVVYNAWDKVLDRKVALKQLSMILSGDNEYILRFRREAQALARLNHPNVVQVYDLVEEGNRLWMVVEYVGGGDLSSYLKQSGRLSVREAIDIVAPVAKGLACAHKQGIVHRDLKPANILLTAERTPKITDFGIAKLSQSGDLTQSGSVLGSPPYMSPEQCSGGSVDSRTDIYALGITLYELLTGEKPFVGDTSSVLARHIVEQPAPLSEHLEEIPVELEDLILQMLAKSPDKRPSEMADIVEMLFKFKVEKPSLERSQLGNNGV